MLFYIIKYCWIVNFNFEFMYVFRFLAIYLSRSIFKIIIYFGLSPVSSLFNVILPTAHIDKFNLLILDLYSNNVFIYVHTMFFLIKYGADKENKKQEVSRESEGTTFHCSVAIYPCSICTVSFCNRMSFSLLMLSLLRRLFFTTLLNISHKN